MTGSTVGHRSIVSGFKLRRAISDGCFIFHFASLTLKVAQPLQPTLAQKQFYSTRNRYWYVYTNLGRSNFIINTFSHRFLALISNATEPPLLHFAFCNHLLIVITVKFRIKQRFPNLINRRSFKDENIIKFLTTLSSFHFKCVFARTIPK